MKHQTLLEKTIQGLGYELLEAKQDHAGVLRLIIDATAGVGINDCQKVSNHLEYLLPVEGIEYQRLEVSSPGPQRPLIKPAHFKKFLDHQLSIELKLAKNSQRNYTGNLLAANDTSIKVLINQNEEIEFTYDEIKCANLCLDINKYLTREKHN